MTYNEFIGLQDSRKILLFEIDRGVLIDPESEFWVKFSSDIWVFQYSWFQDPLTTYSHGYGDYGLYPYGLSGDLRYGWGSQLWGDSSWGEGSIPAERNPPYEPVYLYGSLIVDGENYTKVDDISDLYANDKSFFFDVVTQRLYINFLNGTDPADYTQIEFGVTQGYSNYSTYLDNIYYDGRIKSIPEISTERDSLFYGKISFEGGSATLINTDGSFDNFGQENYYGAECRILFGGDDLAYSEYKILYTGYIEDYQLTADDITINFKDNRKLLSESIPQNNFTKSVYSSLNDSNDGVPIPLGYGTIRKGVAICTNEEATVSTYNFKFVDTTNHTIQSIDQVYVNNKKVAHTNPSLTNGTFDLSSSVYEPGDDVAVDFHGYTDGGLIENPLDVIKDIIINNTNISYTSAFFNLTDWEAATTALTQRVGVWIGEKKEIIDVIEEISSSILGLFIVEGGGKITFKLSDRDADVVDTINIDELIAPPAVDLKSSEYLNSARVRWGVYWASERGSFYTDTTKKQELFEKYKSNVEKEFKTVLSREEDAQDFASRALDEFGGIFPTYTITTKTQNIDVELTNNIDLEIGEYGDETRQYVKTEVLGKSINLNNNTITLKLRYIDSVNLDVNWTNLLRWRGSQQYTSGAPVTSGGQLWRAIDTSLGELPTPDSTFWDELGKLYWFDYVAYVIGDFVVHDGKLWIAAQENSGAEPGVSTAWTEYLNPIEVYKSGSGTFNDTPGATATITHNFNKGDDYFVTITPSVQTSGTLGEVSVINKTATTFDVIKTGSATGITFDYLIALQ
jgi:hypothetical protein